MGAGPVGCHLALSLLGRDVVDRRDLLIIDPRPPLSLWERRAQNCGMRYLRSASVHHIGLSSADLGRYQKRLYRCGQPWQGKVSCPRLELFNSHCQHLLSTFNLKERWFPADVHCVDKGAEGYRVSTARGSVVSKRVILALGPRFMSHRPEWLKPAEGLVAHLLDPNLQLSRLASSSSLAVVGGGMTAVQAALELSRQHSVKLFTRSPIKVARFDVASGWMGHARAPFGRLAPSQRRRVIESHRHPGTINREVFKRLRAALAQGHLEHHLLEKPRCWRVEGGGLQMINSETHHSFDQVLLGTGFSKGLHPLQEQLAHKLGAPLAPCSAPLLDPSLQWLPNLFVVGCHADLQVGPTAPNLLGGRLACERVLSAG